MIPGSEHIPAETFQAFCHVKESPMHIQCIYQLHHSLPVKVVQYPHALAVTWKTTLRSVRGLRKAYNDLI